MGTIPGELMRQWTNYFGRGHDILDGLQMAMSTPFFVITHPPPASHTHNLGWTRQEDNKILIRESCNFVICVA